MALQKTIVCLANSKKLSHRCIAGKEFEDGKVGPWIRPVSRSLTGEITLNDMSFEDGGSPQILDIISIEFLKHHPHLYQTENYLIDDRYYWEKEGSFPLQNLSQVCDSPNSLWQNGDNSTYGLNDRVSLEMAKDITSSLLLIKPDALSILIRGEYNNKRSIRANFTFKGQQYRLKVTDLEIERKSQNKDLGEYPLESNFYYLCVSLGEPYDGYTYKLVASIIKAKDK